MKWNWRPLGLKSRHFVTSEDIMTKFKSQDLHIIRYNDLMMVRVATLLSSLISTLWNIGTLLHKQAKHTTLLKILDVVYHEFTNSQFTFIFLFIKSLFSLLPGWITKSLLFCKFVKPLICETMSWLSWTAQTFVHQFQYNQQITDPQR